MSILVTRTSKVLCQGITGSAGAFHAQQCLKYGTQVVAGVTPGKGGTRVEGIPVFDTVSQAVQTTGADVSMIFVPAPFAADAVLEALDAEIPLIICITEGIPVLDIVRVKKHLRMKNEVLRAKGRQCRLIGPNGPGIIVPGECKVGIMPGYIHTPGPVGIVSRSGTLTYEAVWQLTRRGIGQSTVVGIGGDSIPGTSFTEILELFEADAQTKAVLLIGEIGGTAEEEAAQFFKRKMTKPMFAFVAGRTAPPGKRMGHAGAIIEGGSGDAASKAEVLRSSGIHVIESPAEMGLAVARVLKPESVGAGISA